jgi:hypothetical protein
MEGDAMRKPLSRALFRVAELLAPHEPSLDTVLPTTWSCAKESIMPIIPAINGDTTNPGSPAGTPTTPQSPETERDPNRTPNLSVQDYIVRSHQLGFLLAKSTTIDQFR